MDEFPEVTTYDDARLDRLRVATLTEQERRATVKSAPEQSDRLAEAYLRATGALASDPDEATPEWLPPEEAVMPYPRDCEVAHGGKMWRSKIPNNVWEPGSTDDPQSYRWWEDVTEPVVEPEPGAVPEWNGNGVEYVVGKTPSKVTYEGATYTARQAHTSQPGWTPPVVPALWAQD